MFLDLVIATAALAAVALAGSSDMPQAGLSLDDHDGLTNDNTYASRIADSGRVLEQHKLRSAVTPCSTGDPDYFYAPGTQQCMKIFTDPTTWHGAKAVCSADPAGLKLARPFNALALRSYILQRYSSGKTGEGHVWLNAQGNNSNIEWQDGTGAIIPSWDPLWQPLGNPAIPRNDPNFCLEMLEDPFNWAKYRDQPY